jgi:hypothetical protein
MGSEQPELHGQRAARSAWAASSLNCMGSEQPEQCMGSEQPEQCEPASPARSSAKLISCMSGHAGTVLWLVTTDANAAEVNGLGATTQVKQR